MVPKVAGRGNSFKGAAQYYLHDKGAQTAERVAFAETVNLPTRDPEKAFKCMAWTALHQNEIKARAGGSAKGRKLQYPVYTYSLAWAPDEKPTRQEMLGAAKETLKVLGLHEHEAILVSHRDEPHPHIHVIVNRVHPETGIAAKLSQDHLRLSRWAEAYEKRQGLIRCEQRVENNERRRLGEWVKDRRNYRAGDFYRWRRARVNKAVARRRDEERGLTDAQRKRRGDLHRDYVARRDEAFRDRTRNNWHVMFLHQERERLKLYDELQTPQEQLTRLLTRDKKRVLRFDRETRTGFLTRVHKQAVVREEKTRALEDKQKHDRAAMAKKLKAKDIESVRKVDETYKQDLEALKETERGEREELRREHSRQSQEQARRIKDNRDYADYREDRKNKQLDRIRQLKDELTKPRRPGRVSDQSRKAGRDARKDEDRSEKRGGKFRAFRDAADDMTRDKGRDRGRERERSIRRKPPKDPEDK